MKTERGGVLIANQRAEALQELLALVEEHESPDVVVVVRRRVRELLLDARDAGALSSSSGERLVHTLIGRDVIVERDGIIYDVTDGVSVPVGRAREDHRRTIASSPDRVSDNDRDPQPWPEPCIHCGSTDPSLARTKGTGRCFDVYGCEARAQKTSQAAARTEYKASELGEAALLAYARSRDVRSKKVDRPPPDWNSIGSAKRAAWTRAALAVANLVKPLPAPEDRPSEDKDRYDTPARRAGEAMPIVFTRQAVIALADAAGDALDATRDELNGTNKCAWWQSLNDALDAIPGWPADDPDRSVPALAVAGCTVVENGKPCGEAILVPDVCYDHAIVDPDDIENGPTDPRKVAQRRASAEAIPAKKPAVIDPYGKRLHHLKTWPFPFEDVVAGLKPFEYRRFDRDFRVGDTLVLEKYEPNTKTYSGASVDREITYVLPGGTFGVPAGYCVLGLKETRHPLEQRRERATNIDEEQRLAVATRLIGSMQLEIAKLRAVADAAESACQAEGTTNAHGWLDQLRSALGELGQ